MGLSIADIDKWDPESIGAVGTAAAARAEAASQASSGLKGLSAFDEWQGSAADAAQAKTQSHADNLEQHGQSVSAVATAANTAASEIRQVKSQLGELRSTLGQYGVTVDANGSRVVPPTNMSSLPTATRKLVQSVTTTGQQSLDTLRQAADQADDLLANALRTAGQSKSPTTTSETKRGGSDSQSKSPDFDLDPQFTNNAASAMSGPIIATPVIGAGSCVVCVEDDDDI